MYEVKCINDIYSEFSGSGIYVKKGIFNIVLYDGSTIIPNNGNAKNKLNQSVEDFKLINKKYTTRIDNIYNIFIHGGSENNISARPLIDNVFISMSDFNNYMKVFRNVKVKSLSKKISPTQVNQFNNIIKLIPDKFIYKEILISRQQQMYHKYGDDMVYIDYTFKLHGRIEIFHVPTIISYFKTFTTMNKFESLIKTYAISKM